MTTLTIGRFSMSDGPSAIRHDGDFLELELQIDAATTSTPAEAKVKRQQLLGMVDNPDEGAFPVTFSDDSDLDGFYTVLSVQCEPFEMFLTNGTMLANVSLRRVANGYQNPTVETTVVSRLATNAHSVASTTDFGALAAYITSEVSNVDATGLLSIAAAVTGPNLVDGNAFTVYTANPNTNVAGYWSQFATPSTYYDPPSCTIEYKVGSTWYEAVGRQIPNGVAWRINNGFVRIGTTAALPEANVTIEVADTSTWVGRELKSNNGVDLGGKSGPFVVRNSPEMVVVRVGTGDTHTFTVWKGGTIAMIESKSPVANTFDIVFTSGVAGTAITGGVRPSANDANGNRLTLLCRSAVTADTTNTGIALSSAATSAVFGVGYELGFPNGTNFFTETGMLGQLCTPPQWRQRVAAR